MPTGQGKTSYGRGNLNTKALLGRTRLYRAMFVCSVTLSVIKEAMHYLSTTVQTALGRAPVSREDNAGRRFLFGEMPLETEDVVFLGDSITEGCPWSELFRNPRLKNRGIGNDTTQGVLNRLDTITQAKPSKIFLMIGIVDLDRGRGITAILDNYTQILSRIMCESPETLVYVQSVLPVSRKMGFSLRVTNHNVLSLNTRVSHLSNQLGVNFIDLYSLFVNNGQLNESYTYDGLHLNGRGYLVWKEAIGTLV